MWRGYGCYGLAIAAALPVVALVAALTGDMVAPHWPTARAAVVMFVAAPVVEEIVFRAGLQDWLARGIGARAGPLSVANGLTALVFAFAHLLRHPPAAALATALPALVFGYFYERHRNLAAPIGLHAAYNAAFIVLLTPN